MARATRSTPWSGSRALQAAVDDADGRVVAGRLEVVGVTSAHGLLVRDRERLDAELRGPATDLGAERVWLERIDWQTTAPRSTSINDDAVGETLKVLRRARDDPQTLAALADTLRPLSVKLPAEAKSGRDGIDPVDAQTLARVLEDVERTLPSLLVEGTAA